MTAVVDLKVMSCGGAFVDKALCTIKSSYEFIKNLANGGLRTELLRRIKSVDVTDTQIRFGDIRLNSVEVVGESSIEKELINVAVSIINDMSRKYGFVHGLMEEAASLAAQTATNYQISMQASNFQSECV